MVKGTPEGEQPAPRTWQQLPLLGRAHTVTNDALTWLLYHIVEQIAASSAVTCALGSLARGDGRQHNPPQWADRGRQCTSLTVEAHAGPHSAAILVEVAALMRQYRCDTLESDM